MATSMATNMFSCGRRIIPFFGSCQVNILCHQSRSFSYDVIIHTEFLLTTVHQYTTLPWWLVIGGLTVSLRSIVTLPLAVHQNKIITRMELLQPTLKEYSEALKHKVIVQCRREGAPVEEANRRLRSEARKLARELYSREGCHPMKVALLPWIQLPLWILISLALRNMSGANPSLITPSTAMDSFSTEGVLWFTDLTAPDPLYILPFILSASNLINIEMNALKRRQDDNSRIQNFMTKFFRFLSIGMGCVASQLPSAMSLYWAISSTYSLIQNILFLSPRIRRFFGIPRTPSESQTPYSNLAKKLDERAKTFLKRQHQ